MIDQGNTLATWSFPSHPKNGSPFPLEGKKIQDHRSQYLEYEGPISKGRGRIEKVDQGPLQILQSSPKNWILEFQGHDLSGIYVLERQKDSSWKLDRQPTASPHSLNRE
jgi:hypothetical protein